MILARSPLRITLGGGGTDLPSYYELRGGYVISAAIDKYVYVILNNPFEKKYIIKYSGYERHDQVNTIEHPIIREALKLLDVNPGIEIATMADIPSGTGLGSSGSFTTALVSALAVRQQLEIANQEIAELACKIEIEKLKEPIGKQDQYIAAFGGIKEFYFDKESPVKVSNLNLEAINQKILEKNLILFYTGQARSASEILESQNHMTKLNNSEIIENLDYIKKLGLQSRDAIVNGQIENLGEIMHEHWLYKRRRSNKMSNSKIDEVYEVALRNGAVGGKLVGAGGGGFLIFVTNDREKLCNKMSKLGYKETKFNFDFEGTQVKVF